MKSFQDHNQLIIKETPGMLWFVGLFFAAIGGLFVFGSLGGFSNYAQIPQFEIVLAFVFGSIGVFVGIQTIIRAPVTTVTIDRTLENIQLKRVGWFGTVETSFKFNEVNQFRLLEEKDDEGDPMWVLAMELSSGDVERISTLQSHCEDFKRKFVFETNLFMRKQMPSTATFFELEDDKSLEIS